MPEENVDNEVAVEYESSKSLDVGEGQPKKKKKKKKRTSTTSTAAADGAHETKKKKKHHKEKGGDTATNESSRSIDDGEHHHHTKKKKKKKRSSTTSTKSATVVDDSSNGLNVEATTALSEEIPAAAPPHDKTNGDGISKKPRLESAKSGLDDPFKPREGRDLVWKNVNVTLKAHGKEPEKKILDSVWGEVRLLLLKFLYGYFFLQMCFYFIYLVNICISFPHCFDLGSEATTDR